MSDVVGEGPKPKKKPAEVIREPLDDRWLDVTIAEQYPLTLELSKASASKISVVGSGSVGGKVNDLVESEGEWTTGEENIEVLEGVVLADSFFQEFLKLNNIDPSRLEDLPDELEVPESLVEQNSRILERYCGEVLGVRGSAVGERGGIGVYGTKFFVPTGDLEEDAKNLARRQVEVYKSAFGPDALEYRRKHPTRAGMGLLIQPVVGQWFGDHFMPVVAGSGYVKYDGEPVLRAVLGLGSMAVEDNAVVCSGDIYLSGIEEDLRGLKEVDAINRSGEVERITTPKELRGLVDAYHLWELGAAMSRLRLQGVNYYFEWAAAGGVGEQKAMILQSAPYEDKIRGSVHVPLEDEVLIAEGTDIVNSGKKECNKIILVEALSWSDPKVRLNLEALNRRYSNYLLVVPQEVSSLGSVGLGMEGGDIRIKFRHFSNASAVLEYQYDTSKVHGLREMAMEKHLTGVGHGGRAGQHFQQICDREDILFLGSEVKFNELSKLEPSHKLKGIRVYNVKAVAVNDPEEGVGRVYILPKEEIVEPEYTQDQMHEYTTALRDAANDLCDVGSDLADHFYNVHYDIVPHADPSKFDPWEPDEDTLEEIGVEGLKESLKIVLENGGRYVDPSIWGDIEEYLTEYSKRLESKT